MSESRVMRIKEGSAAYWALKAFWLAAIAVVVIYVPTKLSSGSIGDATSALELMIAVMALNLAFGYAGVMSIGHSAFFGVGGYTTGVLVTRYGWDPGWTIYVGMMLAFFVGCVVALPAFRLKGFYLGLVTLAVAVLFPQLIRWQKLAWLTGGPRGLSGIGYDQIPNWPILGELAGREGRAVFAYWLAFIGVVATYLVCRGLVKSRLGRSLIAMRDNETAAAVMGVNIGLVRTIIFGISAALAGLSGSLATLRTTILGPEVLYLTLAGAITFLLVMVLGGAGTLWGPIVGSVAYVLLDTRTRAAGSSDEGLISTLFGWMDSSPATLILSIVLIIVMFVAPDGIVGFLKRMTHRVVQIVPRPISGVISDDITVADEPAALGIEET